MTFEKRKNLLKLFFAVAFSFKTNKLLIITQEKKKLWKCWSENKQEIFKVLIRIEEENWNQFHGLSLVFL